MKDESFLFELPWSWVEARSDLVLDAEVNPNRLPPEPGYDNNVRTLGALSFATSPRFRLLVNLMRYRHKGIEYVPSAADLKESLDLFRGMLPLASFEAPIDTTYRGFLVSRQVVTDDGLGSRVDQTSSECSDNLCATYYLNARRNVYRYYGQVPGDDVYVFNMINDRIPDPRKPGSLLFARGGAPLGGRVGTGSVRQDFVGVHEMLHNLGRPHPLRSSGDPKTPAESPDTYRCGHDAGDDQFPYADTLLDDRPVEPQVDFLGFDILTRRVLPPTTTDVIGYCNPGAQWISDYTWNATRTQMFATESNGVTRNAGGMAGDWLVFSGIATPSRATGRLLEVQRASSIVEIWTDDAGPYRLRQRGADGSLLAERSFGGMPEPDAAIPQVGFTGAVAFEPGTRTIELVDTRAAAGVLDAREVLPLPPILTDVAIANAPTRLAGPLTLTWVGDSPLQAPLRFDVFVVTPAGNALPLVEGLSTPSAEIDGDTLPGSDVSFRVVANDGVNTAVAESPLYSIEKRPPTADILIPDDSVTLQYGQVLNLSGAGEDPDGQGASLEWTTASRFLGAGLQISVEDLEPGDHSVTLTVTDGDGDMRTASVAVRVLYEPEVPTDPHLIVGPDALAFQVAPAVGSSATGAIEVGNAGPGELAFAVSTTEPWLTVDPTESSAPARVNVIATPGGFEEGEVRTATVVITANDGTAQTRSIPVTVSVGTTLIPEPSNIWLGLASGVVLWGTRRVRRRTRTLLAAAGVAAFAAPLASAAPNALLVVDENNRRVLRVPLGGGPVTVLSPPSSVEENLLTSPRGIGTGPDGEIFVANFFEGTIVFIDARTGAQFPVEGSLSGPPAIGSLPRDVAVNPREPSPGFFRTLGVATEGELHQVVQSSFSTTGSLLADYPSPQTGWLGLFVGARDPGGDGPIDYFVVTNGVPAILRYRGATDSFTVLDAPENATLHGLDATPGNVVTSQRSAACPSMANRVIVYDADMATGSAYFADCPGPVAHDGDRSVTYFVDAGSTPQRVMRIRNGGAEPFANLASATSASDIALYAPEPGRIVAGAWALLALAAARRRGEVSRLLTGRRMQIEPSTTRRTGP